MENEEIEHLLLHALTEDTVTERLDVARSQQEVYAILSELPYFKLSMEEFQQGILAMQAGTGGSARAKRIAGHKRRAVHRNDGLLLYVYASGERIRDVFPSIPDQGH